MRLKTYNRRSDIMHIMEGYLPFEWCVVWYIISVAVMIIGVIQLKRVIRESPEAKKILTINGIVMFLVSMLHMPSLTGSGSNPPASGLTGLLFGPAITSVVAGIVLLLQAFLLAYGGITTLGANILSMGIVGPLAAYIAYTSLDRINSPKAISLIIAVFIANVFTVAATALEYTLAFGDNFFKFFAILSVTQVFFVVIDIIVAVAVFSILKTVYKDSRLFSAQSNDFIRDFLKILRIVK